jgi:hypothetical protein
VRPPVFAFLLSVLATAWFSACGGGDDSPDKAALEGYFARIQAFNDEFESRLDVADRENLECIVLIKQRSSRRRSPTSSSDGNIADCFAESDQTSSSARQGWLEEMQSIEPPPAVKDAHEELTRNASPQAATPGPPNAPTGGEPLTSSIPTIDPSIVRYLEACNELVAVAKSNGIPLSLWCAIESSP